MSTVQNIASINQIVCWLCSDTIVCPRKYSTLHLKFNTNEAADQTVNNKALLSSISLAT